MAMDMLFSRIVRPALRCLSAETGHRLAVQALKLGLLPPERTADDPVLATRVFGLDFANPVGLAAGFDKDAEVVEETLALGFGFVEPGTVTPRPQPGNAKPRLFRLEEDEAVINRYGFNSGGLPDFVARLGRRRGRGDGRGVVGANVGKNRDTTAASADYVTGVDAVTPRADYVVVNVSSPNTPGLRALQARGQIEDLVRKVLAARNRAATGLKHVPPLLVKVAPDLNEEEMRDIAEVALATGIDGLIVGNTTLARPPELRSAQRTEAGGLSGRPLMALSTARLADFYRLTGGRLPLIGCGGIMSGADAYAKIRAGAALVQFYTALVFHGPGIVGQIKRELAARLRADGFTSVSDAVGADHR